MAERDLLGDEAACRGTDQVRALDAQVVEEGDGIVRHLGNRVHGLGGHGARRSGAVVERDDTIAGLEPAPLAVPVPRARTVTVKEKDGRARARDVVLDADAVDPRCRRRHVSPLWVLAVAQPLQTPT